MMVHLDVHPVHAADLMGLFAIWLTKKKYVCTQKCVISLLWFLSKQKPDFPHIMVMQLDVLSVQVISLKKIKQIRNYYYYYY